MHSGSFFATNTETSINLIFQIYFFVYFTFFFPVLGGGAGLIEKGKEEGLVMVGPIYLFVPSNTFQR